MRGRLSGESRSLGRLNHAPEEPLSLVNDWRNQHLRSFWKRWVFNFDVSIVNRASDNHRKILIYSTHPNGFYFSLKLTKCHSTGNNYEHRKSWVDKELKLQAANLGIDLLRFAILSNHLLVLNQAKA